MRPQNATCDIGAFEFVNPATIGTTTLLPTQLRCRADQSTPMTLRWTVPPTMTWQGLRVVVRFSQVITTTDELSDTGTISTDALTGTADLAELQSLAPTDTLALFDSGSEAGTAVVGTPMVIAGDHAMPDLGQTRLQTGGPTGQTVAVTLAVAFKQPMAGKVFTVTSLLVTTLAQPRARSRSVRWRSGRSRSSCRWWRTCRRVPSST